MPTGVVTTGLDLRGGITSIIAAAAIDPQQQDDDRYFCSDCMTFSRSNGCTRDGTTR